MPAWPFACAAFACCWYTPHAFFASGDSSFSFLPTHSLSWLYSTLAERLSRSLVPAMTALVNSSPEMLPGFLLPADSSLSDFVTLASFGVGFTPTCRMSRTVLAHSPYG